MGFHMAPLVLPKIFKFKPLHLLHETSTFEHTTLAMVLEDPISSPNL
jgi:hypothetical protein